MKITPTVGRVVYFNPNLMQLVPHLAAPAAGEPLAAIIVAVLSESCVNLAIFDATGQMFGMTDVPLVQEGEETPEADGFAYWMPYQLAQAGIKPMVLAAAPAPASAGQAPKVEETRINALVASLTYNTAHLDGTNSTVATARLPGGFVVAIGHDACVSAANFDAEKGRKYAIEDAEGKARNALWQFEGYALFLRMEQLRAAGIDQAMPAHQQRVVLERIENKDRLEKLRAFREGGLFLTLPGAEQGRLTRQLDIMQQLDAVLAERINAFPAVPA